MTASLRTRPRETGLRSLVGVYEADGTNIPGRVWAERVGLSQFGTGRGPVDLNLHFMSSLGYVYKANYGGFMGAWSEISADAVGNVRRGPAPERALDCSTSAYRSFIAGDGGATFHNDFGTSNGECGGSFRVFFSEPFLNDAAGVIPVDTANSVGSPTDWVRPLIEPPYFELTDFVGTSETTAAGILKADVDNFFGGVEIEVLDDTGAVIRTFTVNVPEGEGLREVDLPFDGLDDAGNPIPRGNVTKFRVRGLNAGEIHFVMTDVEQLTRGMSIEVINGPTAGTPEASRIYWADSDGFDGTTANQCPEPAAAVNTADYRCAERAERGGSRRALLGNGRPHRDWSLRQRAGG